MYALIDCNNFFASCEKIFRPELEGKPVAILSNNDGCIIARSNEVKALGIPMGAPYFKFKDVIEKNNVNVFSSNYELYGDLSQRVMSTIGCLAKDFEVYSIDEAFISLKEIPYNEVLKYICDVRDTIFKWTGIRVSVGVGPSKTLTKVANHISKKQPMLCIHKNIFDIRDPNIQDIILQNLKIIDIWGISYNLEARLNNMGIKTAKELRDANAKILRKGFSVVLEKIIMELRGIPCLELEEYAPPKKNIMSSRSFGREITNLTELEEAIATYTARACAKLRAQNSKASGIYVFLKSDKYKARATDSNYKYFTSSIFTKTSSDTSFIITVAKDLLKKIYVPDIKYKKAGIMLIRCLDEEFEQASFFTQEESRKTDLLMPIIDCTNKKMGKGTLYFAAEGIKKPWQMKRDMKSPSYTTKWSELPVAI